MSTERSPRHPAFLLGIAQVGFETILNATTLDEAKAIARQARHDIDRPVRGSDAAVTRGRTFGPVGEELLEFAGRVREAQTAGPPYVHCGARYAPELGERQS